MKPTIAVLITASLLFLVAACTLNTPPIATPTTAPTVRPTVAASAAPCGDALCAGPENAQNCPQDCAAASATPEAATAFQTPNWNSPFGINEGVGAIPSRIEKNYLAADYPAEVAQDAKNLRAVGAAWYRLHTTQYGSLSYNRLSRDNFSFARQDELIQGLQAESVAVVIMLGPRGGNERPCQEAYLPMGADTFVDYVRQVVERYDGDGVEDMPGLRYGIHYWQLDNEVDLHWYGCSQEGSEFSSPAEYVAALQVVYPAIHAADPQATVFPSFWFAGQPDQAAGAAYFTEFLALGGAQSIDALDIHDYSFKLENLTRRLERLNELLADHPLPIWVMETSTPSDAQANADWNETLQAQAIVKWYVSVLAHPNVHKLFWHTLYQSPTLPEDQSWKLFGTNGLYDCQDAQLNTTLNFTQCNSQPLSPGGYTYQLLSRQLAGFQTVTALADGIYRFTWADGRAVYVLWQPTEAPLDLTPYGLSGTVNVTHILETADVSQPSIETASAQAVPAGVSPILVEAAP